MRVVVLAWPPTPQRISDPNSFAATPEQPDSSEEGSFSHSYASIIVLLRTFLYDMNYQLKVPPFVARTVYTKCNRVLV